MHPEDMQASEMLDYFADLYAKDPKRWEYERAAVICRAIESVPVAMRDKIWAFQHELDEVRARFKDDPERCVAEIWKAGCGAVGKNSAKV